MDRYNMVYNFLYPLDLNIPTEKFTIGPVLVHRYNRYWQNIGIA